MESLVGELQCPVCLELYTFPVILPCSHVLCRTPCAERLFVQDFIRCPVCRDNCFITGGLENLPRVISLEHIIEQYNTPQTVCLPEPAVPAEDICGPDDIPCQLCQVEPVLKAVRSCLNCNASYCTNCLSLSHPDREPFSQHQLIQPKRYARPREPRCPRHEGLTTVWCQTCQVLGCLFCADDPQTHLGHRMLSIDQAAKMYKEKLEGNLKKLSVDQNMVQMAVTRSEQRLDSFMTSVSDRRDEINKQCDDLITEIENKRSFFLSDLQYEERSKRDTLSQIITGFMKQKDYVLSVIHYTQEVLKEKDKRGMVQLGKLAHDKATKHLLTEGTSADVNTLALCNKVVDMRKERAILRDMTYLRVPEKPVIMVDKCLRAQLSVVLVLDTTSLEYEVIDGYKVYYSRDRSCPIDQWGMIEFTAPHEERKYSRSPPYSSAVCLIHDNLDSDALYDFCIRAYNSAGESDISDRVSCSTLSESQSLLPIPQITEQMCHTYTSAIQIHSPSPQDVATDQQISHFLLYREARANQIWKSIALVGRVDHRVFGLESDMLYDFIIMACNTGGQCQVSNSVTLKTERAAY